MRLNEYVRECHATSRSKGWYDDAGQRNIGEQLMLVVTEVAEAMEDLRVGKMEMEISASGKPEGFPVEIADVMIRLFDLCGYLKIDLETAVQTKMKYNEGRPYRHGKLL